MRSAWLLAIASAIGCSFGDEPDPTLPGLGEGMDSTTVAAEGGEDTPAVTAAMTADDGDAEAGDTTASQDTAPDDDDADTTPNETGPGTEDSGTTMAATDDDDGSSSSESTGGPVTLPYTECMTNADCPPQYPLCSETDQCSVACDPKDEVPACPTVPGGAPQMFCGEGLNVCYVLCPNGEDCPDGMQCGTFGQLDVCAWIE